MDVFKMKEYLFLVLGSVSLLGVTAIIMSMPCSDTPKLAIISFISAIICMIVGIAGLLGFI